jgi:hypothetical protein
MVKLKIKMVVMMQLEPIKYLVVQNMMRKTDGEFLDWIK